MTTPQTQEPRDLHMSEDLDAKPNETLEQEIARLGEHFPQVAALLTRAIKFFR